MMRPRLSSDARFDVMSAGMRAFMVLPSALYEILYRIEKGATYDDET